MTNSYEEFLNRLRGINRNENKNSISDLIDDASYTDSKEPKRTVQINGDSFEVPVNSNVSVINGEVYVNGKSHPVNESIRGSQDSKIIIYGNVNEVSSTTGDIEVNGQVENIKVTSGDVTIDGDVNGDVNSTSGSISVKGNISGKVRTTSGSINRGF